MDLKYKIKKGLKYIRANWFKMLLIIGTLYFIIEEGVFTFLFAFIIIGGGLFSLTLENYHINNAVRYLLDMRTGQDEQKRKSKNNQYEKDAKENAYEVEKLN